LAGATGEGTVHEVLGRPHLAAKVFHAGLRGLADKLDKVAAMVDSQPPGATQPDGFIVLAWPQELIFDGARPIGFVMSRIDTATAVELHTVSNPSNRLDPMPSAPQWTRHATWGHLVNVAANLCLAVESVHRVEAVIGDFQERNILVADTTRVTLVDCDSMQFTDHSGRRFLCPVGRPEFTAPELVGVNLREQPREKPSDLFALAVHIHQLLMAGNHPFLRGQWVGPGAQPSALTLARSGDWAGGPNSRLRTHPIAPPQFFLPNDVQHLFVRAFSHGATDPLLRPSADEWRSALTRVQVTICARGAHQVPVGCAQCPWCRIDDERMARKQRQAWARSATGPQAVTRALPTPSTPQTGDQPAVPPKPAPYTVFGLSPRAYLTTLAVIVTVVVALASFIVWALLSGASTFGSLGPTP
jgi:DNA-binding helix-hairpin-helix protein with protein kinase domain